MNLLTFPQVLDHTGLTLTEVRRAIRTGDLVSYGNVVGQGRAKHFDVEVVDAWVRTRPEVKARKTYGEIDPRTGLGYNEPGTHWQTLLGRRTDEELEALLADVLADLQAGTRKRVPSHAGDPLPF